MKSQKLMVLQRLKRYGSITRLQAIDMGVMELSARLSELQADGHIIDRSMRVYVKNQFGKEVKVGKSFLIKEAKY